MTVIKKNEEKTAANPPLPPHSNHESNVILNLVRNIINVSVIYYSPKLLNKPALPNLRFFRADLALPNKYPVS